MLLPHTSRSIFAYTAGVISAPKPPNAFQYAWRNPWFRLVVFGLLAYLTYRFVGLISGIIINFAVAYLIAYIATPLLNWLERKRVPRGLGVLLVLLAFFGLLVMAGLLFATIATQLIDLLRQLPALLQNVQGWADKLTSWLSARGVSGIDQTRDNLIAAAQTYFQDLGNNIVPILQRFLDPHGALLSSIMSVGNVVVQMVFILLLSVYMMLDYSRVNTSLLKIFPRPWQPHILEFTDLAGTAVGGYVRGQLVIAAFVGLVVAIGLSMLHIPSALAIGFLAGVFNIIPYLGPIIGAAPAMLLAAPSGVVKVLLVILVFVVANQVEGSFLSPLVLSKTTDLHPITVLLSILIGSALLGFAGALIAVPLVALGKLMIEKYYYSSRVYLEGP